MHRLAAVLLIAASAGSHGLDPARREGLVAVCVSCHGAAGITGSGTSTGGT